MIESLWRFYQSFAFRETIHMLFLINLTRT